MLKLKEIDKKMCDTDNNKTALNHYRQTLVMESAGIFCLFDFALIIETIQWNSEPMAYVFCKNLSVIGESNIGELKTLDWNIKT